MRDKKIFLVQFLTWHDVALCPSQPASQTLRSENIQLFLKKEKQFWFRQEAATTMEYERVPHKNFAKAVNIFIKFNLSLKPDAIIDTNLINCSPCGLFNEKAL